VDVLATVLDGRASSAAGGLPLVGGAEAGAVRDACGRGEVRIRRGRLPTARALVLVSDLMGLSGDVVGDVGVERDHVVRDAEERPGASGDENRGDPALVVEGADAVHERG